MSLQINPDTIVSCKTVLDRKPCRISYKKKFLWRKAGFYSRIYGETEFVDKKKEAEYEDLIFNHETKECFYKPYIECCLADGSSIEKIFEDRYALSAWVIKNIPKKFIEWNP